MPLKHFYRTYFVEASSLEDAGILQKARKRMGMKLYNMAIRVFTEFITNQDENKSGGYFHFGIALGESAKSPKKDVDYLWRRMIELYGDGDEANDTIRRVLGTICMMCVAKDSRTWCFKDDMDKKEKLEHNEIPDANEYFIGNYEMPVSKEQKMQETTWFTDSIRELQNKFKETKVHRT